MGSCSIYFTTDTDGRDTICYTYSRVLVIKGPVLSIMVSLTVLLQFYPWFKRLFSFVYGYCGQIERRAEGSARSPPPLYRIVFYKFLVNHFLSDIVQSPQGCGFGAMIMLCS